jgi:hypothetical protein
MLFALMASPSSHALPPEAPRLSLERSGLTIRLDWGDDTTATGYRLHYAPYPAMNAHGSLDLGGGGESASEAAFELWNGAAFLVWLTAYNADGESRYSNIEHFVMDHKVLAFLPNTEMGQQLQAGLQEAFTGISAARLETLFVDPNDSTALETLFFGGENTPGYAKDPNVLAVVTATTAQTLALTYNRELDSPPLVISATGTSTQLLTVDNVVRMAADNIQQGKLLADALKDYAAAQQKHVKYAILLNLEPGSTIYSFDLYDQALLYELEQFAALEPTGGLGADGQPVLYSQLVGSFSHDGTAAGMDAALATLDILQPDVVLHIGYAQYLPALIAKRPGFFWIGSDSTSYAYETYKGKNVAVVSMSGALRDYGYDAGGFLKEVMEVVSGSRMSRPGILQAALNLGIRYPGRTGVKGYGLESPGNFDLLMPGADGWVKIK